MDGTDIISDGYLVGPQKSEVQVALFFPDLRGITKTSFR